MEYEMHLGNKKQIHTPSNGNELSSFVASMSKAPSAQQTPNIERPLIIEQIFRVKDFFQLEKVLPKIVRFTCNGKLRFFHEN